jgi:hypothetical protein
MKELFVGEDRRIIAYPTIEAATAALHAVEFAAHATLPAATVVRLGVFLCEDDGAMYFTVTQGGPGRPCTVADLAKWEDWYETEWIEHVG